ncbi:hypothetical protein [Allopseudospirillum japonicum]|uniref:hypothetical protein n=1 Tax=Allopseudospirillum japonicum TaxID=64971 RepID=UPI00115FFC31|nr:hypothetical protein [Allopseudospirillum japonicum]
MPDLLGERPFSYRKKKSNHLQVKIKGIDKVFHTGATPSDTKSYNNFIGDIKHELKKLHQPHQTTEISLPIHHPPQAKGLITPKIVLERKLQKVRQSIIKQLRLQADKLRKQEHEMVMQEASLQGIEKFRENLIQAELNQALQQKKSSTDYITPAKIKKVHQTLREHLDYMLPPLAFYHQTLKKEASAIQVETLANEIKISADDSKISNEDIPVITQPVQNLEKTTKQEADLGLNTLMKETSNKRVKILKNLSKPQISALVQDLQKALQEKHQEDIQEIINLMKNKGVTLEELQQKINT